MSKKFDYLKASKEPIKAIDLVSYEGQNPKMKQYQAGFEPYFNQLPKFDKIEGDDSMTDVKLAFTRSVMKDLSILLASDFISTTFPNEGEFERTILAIEDPIHVKNGGDPRGEYIAGKQLIVAHWGKGFESPVHGHTTGYLHEQLLNGKLKLNTFRIVDEENKVVIPYKTEIITPGVFISDYVPENPDNNGVDKLWFTVLMYWNQAHLFIICLNTTEMGEIINFLLNIFLMRIQSQQMM